MARQKGMKAANKVAAVLIVVGAAATAGVNIGRYRARAGLFAATRGFNGERAFNDLRQLVELGPRPPGSRALHRAVDPSRGQEPQNQIKRESVLRGSDKHRGSQGRPRAPDRSSKLFRTSIRLRSKCPSRRLSHPCPRGLSSNRSNSMERADQANARQRCCRILGGWR